MSVTAEDSVVIKNIYYMMAYAFNALDLQDYASLRHERFDNLADLMAAILAIGISAQRKRGLERGYQEIEENLQTVRGRIDMRETARNRMAQCTDIACVYDDFNEDTYKNRILKTTALLLVSSADVSKQRREDLKRSVMAMGGIGQVDPLRVEWSALRYHRNNAGYRLLMNVCYMVLHDLLLTTESGEVKLAEFNDSQKLHALYENFVLAYFKREHPDLNASAKVIDRGASEGAPEFLPKLCTDITLERDGRMLIIDTKCYGKILTTHHDKEMLSPANLNQIQSYVMHAAYGTQCDVSGMLLYALTDRDAALHETWQELDHTFSCYTLDLGQEFAGIAAQLDAIAGLVAPDNGS